MQSEQLTPRMYFQKFALVHVLLVISSFIFCFVSIFLKTQDILPDEPELSHIFNILVPVFAIGDVVLSQLIFKNLLKNAMTKGILREKLKFYHSASITKLAVINGAVIFALVGYMLTGSNSFLIIAIVLLIILIINRPSRAKTISELQLNREEIMKLEREEEPL